MSLIIKQYVDDLKKVKASHRKCFQEVIDEINNHYSNMNNAFFDEDFLNFYTWYIYNYSPKFYLNIQKSIDRGEEVEWYQN
jgi:hypothetical protein